LSDDSRTTTQTAADDPEFTRLCDQVSLQLRLNHVPTAAKLSEELLSRWPDSTTAHELAGDVALSQGKVAAARKEYHEALQIEPANIDAERKYGLALVTQTPDERRALLLNQVIADPKALRSSPRKPLNAVLNSLLFPGLGQLYNREHEKGLTMLGVGALLVMLAFYLLVQVPYMGMVRSAESHGLKVNEQIEGARQTMQGQGVGYWLLVTLVILSYSVLYLWGIYDAWRQAQSETNRTLGV
jgi:TM2 domain-containing membrane protein YozV